MVGSFTGEYNESILFEVYISMAKVFGTRCPDQIQGERFSKAPWEYDSESESRGGRALHDNSRLAIDSERAITSLESM